MLTRAVQLADLILFQDIRDHIQKQDTLGVFRKHGVGEISCLARIKSYQASGDHRPPSDPDRCLQVVRIRYKFPVQEGSAFIGHRVRCVAVLVTVSGVAFRMSLIMGNA